MSDGLGWTTFAEGYVAPTAGVMTLPFAPIPGLTAGRALSDDPADAALPVAFVLGALAAVPIRQRAVADD